MMINTLFPLQELNAQLTFFPMTEKQIENVLDKEVIVIYDSFWNCSEDDINCLEVFPEFPDCLRYQLKLRVLRKEKYTEEYRWHHPREDVTENVGTEFEAVKYFAFKPKLFLQNGSLADIQVR